MIRTAPNVNLQNTKHEMHSENSNWNQACIDSNISLKFKFDPNKQWDYYTDYNTEYVLTI